MPIDIEEYQRLKKRSDQARSDADRAAGTIEEKMKQIKADFQVDTIDAAEVELVRLEKEEAEIVEKYNEAKAAFEVNQKGRI